MFKIEHVSIWVKDLEKIKMFYHKYFHTISNNKYINKEKDFMSYFLTFENGCRLEIMSKTSIKDIDRSKEFYGYAHLAISVGSIEKVLELTDNLRKDGYTVFSEPRTTGDGYFESVILDPEGNKIEITL